MSDTEILLAFGKVGIIRGILRDYMELGLLQGPEDLVSRFKMGI